MLTIELYQEHDSIYDAAITQLEQIMVKFEKLADLCVSDKHKDAC